MSKQTLIEGKLFDKILNFFGGSSSPAHKEKFLDTVRKTNPQLAGAFDDWEDDFLKLMNSTRKVYIKNGRDTAEIDKLISKYRGY
jgi:hypothetical protein